VRLVHIIALLALIAAPVHAATRSEPRPVPRSPHADDLRGGKFAVGLICVDARHLRRMFRTRAWMNPRPDPLRAVEEVNLAAHNPHACDWTVQQYEGEPEVVQPIARRPDDLYKIVRFRVLNDLTFTPDGSEFRYLLLPGDKIPD